MSREYTFNLEAVKIQKEVIAPYRDSSGAPKDWFENGNKRYRLTHPSNVWTDISIPFWSMPENTPHPTQKPEKLIAKLILASSNPGDVVFDPFLGSGTTSVTAKNWDGGLSALNEKKSMRPWRNDAWNWQKLIRKFRDLKTAFSNHATAKKVLYTYSQVNTSCFGRFRD